MRIAVFGSGAVGGYFGGRLAQGGEDVVFIARGEHLAAIRTDGLRVSSVLGDFLIRPAAATDDPAGVGPADLVLLGVKAWQVPEAAEAIRPLVGPQTLVLPLQNGIEAPDQLAQVLGPHAVLGGLCRIIAYLEGPGRIRHGGGAPYVGFGALDGTRTEGLAAVERAFARTRGLTAELVSDIRAAMWSKFMFIAALSGVGAVTRAPIGVIRSQPETRRLLEEALREVYRLSAAEGVALAADGVEAALAFVDSLPPDGTTSMQRDIAAGRPSELEAQSGAVVRLAERLGVAVPTHRAIHASLLPLERRARGTLGFD